jgi:NADH-quinone oxidoreductase subunit K
MAIRGLNCFSLGSDRGYFCIGSAGRGVSEMILAEKLTSMAYWSHFVSIALFALGLLGFLTRRNALIVLMSLELMLNAVNLLLVQIAMRTGTSEGIVLVVFVITVAAAEVAVGLGIILNLYRMKKTVDLGSFRNLSG